MREFWNDFAEQLHPLAFQVRRQVQFLPGAHPGQRRRHVTGQGERLRDGRHALAFLSLPAVRRAGEVLAYHAFGSEPETLPFLRALLAGDKGLLLPRIDRAARALTLHRVRDLDADLTPGPWGIREPDPRRCPPVRPGDVDLVLVPGVAFDAGGGRLGYGGGYYDRLLGTCADATPPACAGSIVSAIDQVNQLKAQQGDATYAGVLAVGNWIVVQMKDDRSILSCYSKI